MHLFHLAHDDTRPLHTYPSGTSATASSSLHLLVVTLMVPTSLGHTQPPTTPNAPPFPDRFSSQRPPSSPRLLAGETSSRASIPRNRYKNGEKSQMPCMTRAASSFVRCELLVGQHPQRPSPRKTYRLSLPLLSHSPPVLFLSRMPSQSQR
jgi:hypothetical protein